MNCCRSLILLAIALLPPSLSAQESIRNSVGMSLKLIPAGHYVRGDTAGLGPVFNKEHPDALYKPDQTPIHPVRITKPFYLSSTEVTVGQFRQFVEATGYRTTAETDELEALGFKPVMKNNRLHSKRAFNRGAEFNWKNPGFEQTDEHPVACVSWNDAQAFCSWLSEREGTTYRLPTEAEWEYACRAGAQTAFSWGNQYVRAIHEKANVGNVELEKAHEDFVTRQWFIDVNRDPGDRHIYTAPVGSFPANTFDLHDMHGNVWEWCHDTYHDRFYRRYESKQYPLPHTTAVDPVNEEPWNEFGDWRVIRGGSWYTAPIHCRSDRRGYFDAPDASCYLGFRVARSGPADVVEAARAEWEKEQAATAAILNVIRNFHIPPGSMVETTAMFGNGDLAPEVTEELYRITLLTGMFAYRADAAFLKNAAKITALKRLDVHNIPDVIDADVAPLAALKNLESLTLGGQSKLTDGCVDYLTGLTTLKQLHLSGPGITDEGLSRFQNLKQIESLNLNGTQTRGAILSSLGEIPLKRLSLPDLSDQHAARLADLPLLESFAARGESLTDRGFAHLAGLTRLTGLDLRGCRSISDSGFGPVESLTKLTRLDLRQTQAGDEAARAFGHLHQLSNLSLGSHNLTNVGMRQLCEAISLQNLGVYESPDVTDEGLLDFWRLQRLHTLDLHLDNLTGTGFSTLVEAKNIGTLRIRSRSLTDAAFEHLGAMPKLRHLEINGDNRGGPSALTDDGLLLLADADTLKSMRLDARNTQITAEGIERFKQQANSDLVLEVQR